MSGIYDPANRVIQVPDGEGLEESTAPEPELTGDLEADDLLASSRRRAELKERDQPKFGWPCLHEDRLRLRYNPVAPSPKQALFLSMVNRECLYGGAAAGGKSWALLMAALQFADVPGYNALILRRTLTDLKLADGLIDISKDWLTGKGPKYNANDYRWTFPSGAVLQFGYLATPDAALRYKSSQWQFVGFDELTEFPWEDQYTYLFSRMRRAKKGLHAPAPDGLSLDQVPIRMRGATNPGGRGAPWVMERFVDREKRTRAFLPALLSDNPGIDADEYREMLAELPEIERKRLEDGDWEAYEVPGALWKLKDITRLDHDDIAPPSEVDVRVIAIDPSVSEAVSKKNDEAGLVMGSLTDGIVTIEEDFSGRMHPDDWAKLAVLQYHAHGCSRIIAERNNGGELVVSAIANWADILDVERPNVYTVHPHESKEARAIKVKTAYKPGKVRHLRKFRSADLENQMTTWVPGQGDSPDRVDALVWCVRNLLWGEGDLASFHTPAPVQATRDRLMGRRRSA